MSDPRFTSSGRIEIVKMGNRPWHILEVSVLIFCLVVYVAGRLVS